jgi:lipid A ethanolaminephosphotransferase
MGNIFAITNQLKDNKIGFCREKKVLAPDISATDGEKNNIKWTAFFFVFILFLFESYLLQVNHSAYFIYLLDTQTLSDFSLVFALNVASLYFFFRFIVFALLASWFYKMICLSAFTLAAFVEYSYQKALGRFSASFDIVNALATTPEQQIASLSMYLNFLAVAPSAGFLICLLIVKKKKSVFGIKKFAVTLLMFTTFFGGLSYFGDLLIERKFPLISFNAFCMTASEFLITDAISNGTLMEQVTGRKTARRSVGKPLSANDFQPANNIVLVIDESVRGDHLSLNGYERKTTLLLDELVSRGVLRNWGIAAAASTGSRFSYNALVTGLTPDDFPDKTEVKVKTFPTIFQYAKAMNYRTHFFDGQMKNYWGAIEDDKNYIDDWTGVDKFNANGLGESWEIDNQIARRVKEITSTSKGNFILVFKHGSHIPYNKNFPVAEEVWKPSYVADNQYSIPDSVRLPEVVNAYDNSLRYNINSFFKNLVDDYSNIPNNSVIIYTGDHGQTLFTNGKSSHGGETKAEAAVPLFIIGKLDGSIDTGYQAAHQNLFPTLLDLMGYPENLRERRNALSLLKAKSTDSKLRFFNPNLDSKIPFD